MGYYGIFICVSLGSPCRDVRDPPQNLPPDLESTQVKKLCQLRNTQLKTKGAGSPIESPTIEKENHGL